MVEDAKKQTLSGLVEVKAGYPFRGKIASAPNGSVAVVQMKDVSSGGLTSLAGLTQTELPGLKAPNWLNVGDILFLAKGRRNYAVTIEQDLQKTVCSPHFFHLRVKNPTILLPSFLAWQLNQAPAQQYFAKSAEGSLMPNIRRAVLEKLLIALPSIQMQQLIVDLAAKASREKQILTELIETREKELDAIAQQLLGQMLEDVK